MRHTRSPRRARRREPEPVTAKKKPKHRSRHHILPQARGGGDNPENLLNLWYHEKHVHWHALFGLRTIEEAIGFLERVQRAVDTRNEKLASKKSMMLMAGD